MAPTFLNDAKVMKLYEKVKRLRHNGDHSKALEILDDMISVHGEDENLWFLRKKQNIIFRDLVEEARDADMEVVYYLGSLGCVTEDVMLSLSSFCTRVLLTLGERLGSVLYYKECVRYGRQGLSGSSLEVSDPAAAPVWVSELLEFGARDKKELEDSVKEAELRIGELNTMCVEIRVPREVCDSEKRSVDRVGELRSYWMGLDVKVKRDFMKVSIEKLRSFVKGVDKGKGVDVLEHVLAIAREHKSWRVWVCRSKCDKVCFSAEECRTHLEQKHTADLEKDMVMRIGRNWANKIQDGGWEPVDTVAAVDMINTQVKVVKEFTSKSRKKGWSDQWPLAVDEERSGLLKEVKLLLVSLCEHQILSCSIRDWVMRFAVKHLRKLDVSEQSIKDCHILETPQSICFLERDEIIQIRGFLKMIKCERHDGTDVVSRAVDSLLDRIRIKENIDFDEQFSLLLLDKRLLKRNIASFDDDHNGKIHFIENPDVHYANAQAQGDDMISWLGDHSSGDKSFPKPIREHNLAVSVTVLRFLHYTCRALRSKYAKKKQVLDYEAALTVVENLCMLEDERRKIVQEDQRNSYASLLCKRSEERLPENSLTAKLFLCTVRDVLNGAWDLTFDFSDLEECMSLIREGKCLSNDTVLKSIGLLKSLVTEKVLLIDAKILLIDNSRIKLLDNLTRLSAFDNRSYMLHFLKPFLLRTSTSMDSLVDKTVEKKPSSNTDIQVEAPTVEGDAARYNSPLDMTLKRTSTNMASPVDKLVEQRPSKDLEPVEEDSVEPEEILGSEKGPVEISSTNDIQEEANSGDKSFLLISICHLQDMQDKPGEDSLSGHLESALGGAATKDNSALDMTLKITSTRMASPLEHKTFSYMSSKPSVDLEPGGTSQSLETMEEGSMEPEVTLTTEKGPLEISFTNDIQGAIKVNSGDILNMPGEDSVSGNLESGLGATRYNSALDMTLKVKQLLSRRLLIQLIPSLYLIILLMLQALLNISVLKEQVLKYNKQPCYDNLEEQVLCALESLFTSVVSEEIKTEGVYSLIMRDILVSLDEVNSMSRGAAEVLVTILESWHCWKISERESVVTRLFTLEENERMSCRKCRREPNYTEQSSYGIVMAADLIRNMKCAFEDIKFVDILKVDLMNYKMLCDIETGGCGTTNCVHHVINRCPPIFTIVLEWEKSETEKEIAETTKALEWEIDISRLYKGLEPNTNYRLVSMVGYSEEEEEHICMAYEKNRWVNLRRESLAGEVVGNWKSVVRFCGERKIRPEILFYEAAPSMMT
ncbi:unnamed protein product [Eruca vesicaria subsp. sativa]|uniref:C2H2-type domain-containing protein n=1 Tax=Eruca vesicaria subsp. sativa TaxID=29727 RepID=A0ABC8L414_ERUVS|nr:unnamed protein product [Eruca vesicaria subsp. sativa]